jgi:hypothetical protein
MKRECFPGPCLSAIFSNIRHVIDNIIDNFHMIVDKISCGRIDRFAVCESGRGNGRSKMKKPLKLFV